MQLVHTPDLTGRTLEEVLSMQMDFIPGGHWHVRVTKRDGKGLMKTNDARSDRINLEIEDGIVVAQHVG